MRIFKCLGVFFIIAILVTYCSADANDIEDDEASVVEESEESKQKNAPSTLEKDLDPEDEAATKSLFSPDVETSFLFTEPQITGKELPTGSVLKLLVGFLNKGDQEFTVESMDVSFRYPTDYSFYIQNYTDAVYRRTVAPKTESTFEYSFIPSEAYAGRPLGLSINLHYTDANNTRHVNNVYNETVTLVEDESGFNPETGFLYVVFACIVVLLLVLGQQFLSKMRKKHGMTKRPAPVEMGTSKNGNIDYDWIPRELLQNNKSSTNRRDIKSQNNRQNRKDQ